MDYLNKVIKDESQVIAIDFDGVIHTDVDNHHMSRNPKSHNRRDNPCFQLIIQRCFSFSRRLNLINHSQLYRLFEFLF